MFCYCRCLSLVESSRVADGVCSLIVAILNNRMPNGNGAAAAASVVMVNWPTAQQQQHHRIECFVYRSCPLEVRIIIVKWRRWKGRNSSVRRGWMLFSWQRLSPDDDDDDDDDPLRPSVPVEQTVESNSNLLLSFPASVKLQSQTQTLTIQFSSVQFRCFVAHRCRCLLQSA